MVAESWDGKSWAVVCGRAQAAAAGGLTVQGADGFLDGTVWA